VKLGVTNEERAILHRAKEIRAKQRQERQKAKPPQVVKVGQEPRERDNGHLARVRRLPCLATLILTGQERYGVDAAHVRHGYPAPGWGGNPGMGSKPHDWRTLPLCRDEHKRQHDMNEAAFWRDLRIDPPAVCAELRVAPDFNAMLGIIRRFAEEARRG
jgi:hypothetical protein